MDEDKDFSDGIAYCEGLIDKIESIISAKVVVDADGTLKEIHVNADPKGDPGQIVREIEKRLIADLDTGATEKVIAIAQIESEDGVSQGHSHEDEDGDL